MSIANCGIDERGRAAGGKAGDQNGREWRVRSWYSYPWKVIIRHPDAKVRAKIAALAKAGALNNHIGYDQSNRLSFWNALKAAKYNPSKIKTNVEADCSASTAACVKAAGHLLGNGKLKNVPASCTTRNLEVELRKAGFKVLKTSKYTKSDKYLIPGDIMLCPGHHVAINLSTGSGVKKKVVKKPAPKPAPKPASKKPAKKSVTAVAKEVIAGKWGTGDARKAKLKKAGYDYNAVQKEVNKLLK